jgi:WS/DGAT/MGAT family acyltransferase
MKHLSGLDASFLHLETPEMPMHVGGLALLELPAGYQGEFYEDFKNHIISRMHLNEVFTRKLALMPFELSNPVWVEDEYIDIDYHVRRITLPRPGTFKQLEAYVGRLHSSLLDRSRPLWEMYVIDGLQSGQAALYTKVHHAGVDGQAGAALSQAIFDTTVEPRTVRPPRPKPRTNQYQLGVAELATGAVGNAVTQVFRLIRTLPGMARAIVNVLRPESEEDGKRHWALPRLSGLIGPRTPFNVAITNQRSYVARSIPLAETKAIAKSLGGSINDVVLATCAGALRRYLRELHALPKGKSLIAAVPVSLREAGNTESNNQVSMSFMTLATDIDDPIERVRAIQASSANAKSVMGDLKSVLPTDFPGLGAPWLMTGLVALFGRSGIANHLPPIANVVVSNVPGPQTPLYVAGALLCTNYPVSIPAHSMALNMTVQSYNGSMDYGLIACRRAVPDIGDLGDFLVDEHRKLLGLSGALQTVKSPSATVHALAGARSTHGATSRSTKHAARSHNGTGRNGAAAPTLVRTKALRRRTSSAGM